jgi:inner membrane transporter RhtA
VSAAPAAPPRRALDRVPPVGLVLAGICSIQVGAAFATTLFDELGAAGTSFLRLLFAAVLLLAIWRPRLRESTRSQLRWAGVFGLTLAAMNLTFYLSIDRIPLGVAVTLEMVGPLTVAALGSHRRRDLLWVGLAAVGVLLLAEGGTGELDALGIALALVAGGFWGVYILLNARTGPMFRGGAGLAIAMSVGALALVPVGVASAGSALLDPALMGSALLVAMLSSAIPYSLEVEALRRIPTGVFGVLMSLEPAVAALAGFVVVGQDLGAREIVAIVLVVAASAGATRRAAEPPLEP